jgi:acetyl-CoA carboxylase carboxyltransferase component
VLRQNGTSSIIDFVSVSDSNGTQISTTDQIIAGEGNPTFLQISPNGENVGVAFQNRGMHIYSETESNEAYIPVIAAVVGAVVAGSVGAVLASTAPAVMATTAAPSGIIGIAEVQNVAQGNAMKIVE